MAVGRIPLPFMAPGATGTGDFDSRIRACLAGLADRDPGSVEELIRDEPGRGASWDGELRGLFFLGGTGDIPFDGGNVWGVPQRAGLAEALRRIWLPVADRCPDFVATVRRETLALALVREAGRDALGYLFLDRLGSPEPPPRDLDELRTMSDPGWLAWTWGGPPVRHDATVHVGVLGRPVPGPIRDLARIHGTLVGQEGAVRCDAFDESLAAALLDGAHGAGPHAGAERIHAGVYERYVHVADWGPGGESNYLALDHADMHGDPCVVTYNGPDRRIRGGVSFWEWFNACGPLYLFENEAFL